MNDSLSRVSPVTETVSAAMDDMRDPDVARALRLEELDQRASNETLLDDPRVALGAVVDWWEHLPNDLRQDIEGSGRMPGCIARAERLAAGHAQTPAVNMVELRDNALTVCARVAEKYADQGRDGYQIAKAIRRLGTALSDTSTDRPDGYRGAWLEMIAHCNEVKADRFRLEQTIRDSIEALERNSTSAPVVECLKAALPVSSIGGSSK